MHCFMCYLLVWSVAQAADTPAQRSLFRDVLHSLLIPTTEHQVITAVASRGNKPQHRLPKTIQLTNIGDKIDPTEQRTTQKPKRTNRPKLPGKIHGYHKLQSLYDKDTNTMAGESHIGNVKSQSVLKPTIIVNIKGSNNIESRYVNKPVEQHEALESLFSNEFNINQRIKFDGFVEKGDSRSPLKQAVVYNFKG